MGLFSKIKSMFKKDNNEEVINEQEEKVEKVIEEEPQIDEVVEEVKEQPKEEKKKEEKKKEVKEEPKKESNVEKKAEEKQEVKESVKVYEKGLTKTRENFVSKLINLTNKHSKVDEEYFDELEEILIMADIGVDTVMSFMDRLRKRVRSENIEDLEYLKEVIVDELFIIYVSDEVIVNKINFAEKGPTVILFVGVNGVGKTTTIAKIAAKLHDEGKKVMMVAGDTFRAGATEQLEE